MDNRTIGLLHPGEMGAAVGQCLAGRGHQVLWIPEGRSPATGARAASAGLTAAGLAELIERSDIIMSVCPPHAALDVARQVAGAGFMGVYMDANAISPVTAREVAGIVETAGASYVDGGIIGTPPVAPGFIRLYLSGPRAGEMRTMFDGSPVDARMVDHEPGSGAGSIGTGSGAGSIGTGSGAGSIGTGSGAGSIGRAGGGAGGVRRGEHRHGVRRGEHRHGVRRGEHRHGVRRGEHRRGEHHRGVRRGERRRRWVGVGGEDGVRVLDQGHRGHDGRDGDTLAQVHVVFGVPLGSVHVDRVTAVLAEQVALGKRRALVRALRLGPQQDDLAVEFLVPQGFGGLGPGQAGAGDHKGRYAPRLRRAGRAEAVMPGDG